MEKLENENVSLEFQAQSLLKERENIKLEYQKLFDSIKRTRTQSQKEINKFIESVNQKTCAYGDTSPTKKKHVDKNTNVIAPGMYKVNIANKQEMHTQYTKNVFTSIVLKDVTSVRRPSSRGSSSKNSVLSNSKNHSEDVEVHIERQMLRLKRMLFKTKRL
ncbi:hypothetical protein Tco_0893660 [Tanacetum coccineum]|uniref:Uncharacterized protein n=1 Tax=Tanacetum coccineum TaxID=301880 RepID=A0ABQ5CAT2_9ASTR